MITARPATRTKTAKTAKTAETLKTAETAPPFARPLPDRPGGQGTVGAHLVPTEQPSDRRTRRLERHRRIREEILVAVVLLAFLAITVALLAQQWLDSTVSFVSSISTTAFSFGGLT